MPGKIQAIDIHSHIGNILYPSGGNLIFKTGIKFPHSTGVQFFQERSLFRKAFAITVIKKLFPMWDTNCERRRNASATMQNFVESLTDKALGAEMLRIEIVRCVCAPIAPNNTYEDMCAASKADQRIIPFTTERRLTTIQKNYASLNWLVGVSRACGVYSTLELRGIIGKTVNCCYNKSKLFTLENIAFRGEILIMYIALEKLTVAFLSLALIISTNGYVGNLDTATIPSPTADVSGLMSEPDAQSSEPWKDAYSEFLRGVETYDYRTRDYIVPGNFDIPPVFCIYDIDQDKMPELILVSDDGDWEPYFEVFTYAKNTVNKVGSIKCDWFGQIGSPDNNSGGLFSEDSYKGHYGKLYHYTIQDGVLVERLVTEWQFRPGLGENAYAYIYEIAKNTHDFES
jgi:hypothetical protein